MSDANREAIGRWVDLVFKIGTPLALAALFFLKSSFATKAELEAVSVQVRELQGAIAVMVEQNRTNERQDQKLADHESRIRVLEFAKR